MTGATLLHEFDTAADNIRGQANGLATLGITGAAVIAAGGIGAARIGVDGNHYEPSPEGRGALVVPVRTTGGELADLIAFQTARPDKWWLRLGAAPLLGMAAVEKADYLELPLHIFGNPLDWLRAEGSGAVVLDWRCCLPFWLSGTPRLIAHNPLIWKRLAAALHSPSPRFHIKLANEGDHAEAA